MNPFVIFKIGFYVWLTCYFFFGFCIARNTNKTRRRRRHFLLIFQNNFVFGGAGADGIIRNEGICAAAGGTFSYFCTILSRRRGESSFSRAKNPSLKTVWRPGRNSTSFCRNRASLHTIWRPGGPNSTSFCRNRALLKTVGRPGGPK